MSLKEVFCQDRGISILQRAFAADKCAHAYIFAGPEGVGKFRTAREWAKMLLCKGRVIEDGFTDSCGSCESCRLFEAGSHPDFHHVYKELLEFTKDGKGKTTPVELPIDVIREFLIDKASNRPILSRRRVFVVSEAEKSNDSSQNALLKVLEEPAEYCCIILLCTRLEELLATTKSRCQIVRFGPVAEERIVERLTEMGVAGVQARYFARLAQGSLGQACQWAWLELAGADVYATKRKLLVSLSSCEYAEALNLAEWVLGESKRIAGKWVELDKATSKADINRRTQKTLVQIIISALHDAMSLRLGQTGEIANFEQTEQIERLTGRFGAEQSAEEIAHCYRALRQIESNVNERLVFEQLLLETAVSDIIKI
ncbi:MAG TPA: DNA polymerase III subunit delta' C-terminal domain-containing protein [Sedimentisphaerales bacterium]|nr:DNA polymerase III subunit delta' C-terminal domain-containing protein [Sedimentisphaerales bacterium]